MFKNFRNKILQQKYNPNLDIIVKCFTVTHSDSLWFLAITKLSTVSSGQRNAEIVLA